MAFTVLSTVTVHSKVSQSGLTRGASANRRAVVDRWAGATSRSVSRRVVLSRGFWLQGRLPL